MRADQLKFINDMNKKFGKNAIRQASDILEERAFRVPTGTLSLDIALGGGYPLGRFIQLSGAFSSAKSTLSYHGMRNFQEFEKDVNERVQTKKKNPKDSTSYDAFEFVPTGEKTKLVAELIQSEANSWSNAYGRSIGIDIDELMFNPCAGMEEALEIAHRSQEEGIADLIVIDSLEALVPMKEYDKDMIDTLQMGIKPKLFGEYFRKFQATNNRLSREGVLPTTLIGINQLREKIGSHGDPEYTPGGRAIGFAASIDLRLRRGDWIKIGSGVNEQIIGQQMKFKVHKNKTGTPQRTGVVDFYFDEGGPVAAGFFDNVKEVIEEGVAYGVLGKSGAWFNYRDIKVNGLPAFTEMMRVAIENEPDLYEELRERIIAEAITYPGDLEDRFGEDNSEENFEDE